MSINYVAVILPKNRHDAKGFLLLNKAGQVVAEKLAKHFVDHRGIGSAHNRIAKFPFDRAQVDSTFDRLW